MRDTANKPGIAAISQRYGERTFAKEQYDSLTETDPVCAVVVAYFPDQEFGTHINDLLHQVKMVVVVDNTPDENQKPCLSELFQDSAQVHLIRNHANLGIAVALNQGLDYAVAAGCKWILTLDQDSKCYPDMVDTLVKVSYACCPKPAVIGGNYLDPRNNSVKVPISKAGDFRKQKTVITSGSLIDVRVAKAIGGFRDDYFIDQVDHELCLRMRATGHEVVICCKPVMTHCVGESGGVRLRFLGVLPNHSPLRKYYIARNAVVTIADYWRQEPAWCIRRLVRLLLGLGLMALLEEDRIGKVRAFASGVVDGLRRRMGPCTRESIMRSRANTQ